MAAGLKESKEVAGITSLSKTKHLKIWIFFFNSDLLKISILFFNCHHIFTVDVVMFTIRLYSCNKKTIYDVTVLLIIRVVYYSIHEFWEHLLFQNAYHTPKFLTCTAKFSNLSFCSYSCTATFCSK